MLQKTVTTPSGYDANVWKITEIVIDPQNGAIHVCISGFKDEQAARGKIDAALLHLEYDFLISDFSADDQANVMAGVASIYSKIATFDEFQ